MDLTAMHPQPRRGHACRDRRPARAHHRLAGAVGAPASRCSASPS